MASLMEVNITKENTRIIEQILTPTQYYITELYETLIF